MNKYRPTKGARFNKDQAQALGETLEKIGFEATPEQIVEAAHPASSSIHDLFVWDNTAAAHQYRLVQARGFINHLEIIVITDQGERATKAFHSVVITRDDSSVRGYCSLESIIENEDLSSQVIRKALAELSYWRTKYAEYKAYPELAGVFKAIARVKRIAKPKRRAKQKLAG